MGTVMGLSLTADVVGWVLMDVDAGGINAIKGKDHGKGFGKDVF